MARSPLSQWQRTFYLLSRMSGDAAAAQRGTLGRRLVRRSVTRALFRGLR